MREVDRQFRSMRHRLPLRLVALSILVSLASASCILLGRNKAWHADWDSRPLGLRLPFAGQTWGFWLTNRYFAALNLEHGHALGLLVDARPLVALPHPSVEDFELYAPSYVSLALRRGWSRGDEYYIDVTSPHDPVPAPAPPRGFYAKWVSDPVPYRRGYSAIAVGLAFGTVPAGAAAVCLLRLPGTLREWRWWIWSRGRIA